ncbi:MAG: DNA polymerase III subunit beta [Spiroplasma sp.]|nr:DNA polymerase III subunit beta [Spiroplasma sp.]
MKFKIKSQLLLTNIKRIIKISPSNPINEIYKNLKVEVDEEKITFSSLNEKVFMNFFILSEKDKLEIYQTGKFLINLKILYDIINKLKDEWILFEIKINALIINNFNRDNNFIFKLNTLDINNFPEIDFSKNIKPILINKKIIEEINSQINFVINTNNSNNILRGINFNFNKNALVVTGTDRISMAQKIFQIKNDFFNQDITIPIFLLNDIEKVTNDINSDYLFYLNDDQTLVIEINNFLFKGRLIDGQYPKIQNVIQQYLNSNTQEKIIINDLKTFLNTIELAVVLAKKESIPLVQLLFDKTNKKIEIICISNNNSFGEVHEQFNNVTFLNQEKKVQPIVVTTNENSNFGELQETISNMQILNQTQEVKNLKIVFNYYLLTHALKTFIKCKQVTLNIISNYKNHTIITSDEDSGLAQLVLPTIKN